MKIRNIADRRFRKFGTVIKGIDVSFSGGQGKDCAGDRSGGIRALRAGGGSPGGEQKDPPSGVRRDAGGGGILRRQEPEGGYLEYHRSEEVNIAASDLIVVVGSRADMDSAGSFDLARAEAYFVPEGTVYLFYSSTLHYAPCSVKADGFCSVVILRRGPIQSFRREGRTGSRRKRTACFP